MNRGDVWLAEIGGKRRPVLVLTRDEVLDVRRLVTVVEVTRSVRGLEAEMELDLGEAGLTTRSVINCDGIHTITQKSLTKQTGFVDDETLTRVCSAVHYALGC